MDQGENVNTQINRRQFLQVGAATLAVGTVTRGAAGTIENKPMNVLYVIADQHQAACMGVEGHPQAITPNMDALASRGVRFASCYAQHPICTPSRVSILSGQYCHNHGYYGLNGPRPPVDLPSVLQHFRHHGYRTAAIGKVHTPDEPTNWLSGHCDVIGECYSYHGEDRGLSAQYGAYLEKLGLRDREDSVRLPEFPGVQQHEGRPSNLPYRHTVEGWTVSETIRFMDEAGDQPFFIQSSLPRPHECYTPDRRFWDMYPDDLALPPTIHNSAAQRPPNFQAMVEGLKKYEWLIEPKTFDAGCRRVWRAYLACITQVDYALGELVSYLRRTGKDNNTIIVYGSDHGAYSGTFGVPEKAPGICSEAVCRVPQIWHVPGVTKEGLVCHQLVENIDVAPTLASLCGLPPMDTINGYDLSQLLKGEDNAVREVAVTENVWSKALRWGPWRFVHYPHALYNTDVGELYNLKDDPNETRNLYHDAAAQTTVAQCRKLLLEWLIVTTRYVTVLPPPLEAQPHSFARLAEDYKESSLIGVDERVRRHQLNYL
jgi:arylsulfatase A-like enzyme